MKDINNLLNRIKNNICLISSSNDINDIHLLNKNNKTLVDDLNNSFIDLKKYDNETARMSISAMQFQQEQINKYETLTTCGFTTLIISSFYIISKFIK